MCCCRSRKSRSPTPRCHRRRKIRSSFSRSPNSRSPSSKSAESKYAQKKLKKEGEERKRLQHKVELKKLEEMARRLEEEFRGRVEEKLSSEEARLEIERQIQCQKKLFDNVDDQPQKGEEAALVDATPKKEEQALKEREELDKMLEENPRRVEALKMLREQEERLRELKLIKTQNGETARRTITEDGVHENQTIFDGNMGPELGRQHEFFRDSHRPQSLHPHSHPHGMHEAILRVFEKERIRDEIIISEIARRRVLEAKIRRVLMMGRELPLQRGGDGFPFGLSPQMEFDSPIGLAISGSRFGGSSVEERTAMPLHESGGSDTLPLQRGNMDLRVSEVEPVSGGGNEKLMLLAKPDENISGSKRKALTPPRADFSELPSDEILKKKAKEESSGALSQVSPTCNKHLQGNKLKSIQVPAEGVKSIDKTLVFKKKNQSELVENVPKNDDPNKKNHNFFLVRDVQDRVLVSESYE